MKLKCLTYNDLIASTIREASSLFVVLWEYSLDHYTENGLIQHESNILSSAELHHEELGY